MESIVTSSSSLTESYPLTKEAISSYQKNGHLLLRNVLSAQAINLYRKAIHEAVARYSTETRKLEERDTYGKAFLQIFNLWQKDEAIQRFTLAKRFGEIAAKLMGCEKVRIYHDQALFKEAGGGPTPWHQDQYYWPLDTNQTITMWMPMVDITARMGIMQFASGSHREGYLDKMGISDASQNFLDRLIKERNFPLASASFMEAGDATFHNGWTLHCAPGNESDTMREVMTVIYYADGAKAIEPDNANRKLDLERWLPGVKPGGMAASDINPLI